MFSFIQTIIGKIVSLGATAIIAMGIVSVPSIPEEVIINPPQEEVQAVTTSEEIKELRKEIEELKKETKKEPKIQTQVKIESPIVKEEVITPIEKNFRDPVLESINAQINSYKFLTNWIDSDMMPLLSQRESMLNGFISNTNFLMVTETAPDINHLYSLFIEEYNLDKKLVDYYRREVFDFIKQHINNEKLSKLNSEYAKYSAKSTVSETEYNTAIQSLQQYESNWQSLYNDGVKKAMIQYMSQTNTRDETYKRYWLQMSQLYVAVADLKKLQALESSFNQLYLQQPKPLNCTLSSHYNGFSTVGSLNCF